MKKTATKKPAQEPRTEPHATPQTESARLAAELQTLETRREDFAGQLAETQTALAREQSAVADGKGDLDKATTLQSRATTLAGVVRGLDTKIEAAQTALEDARADEFQAKVFDEAAPLILACNASLKELQLSWSEGIKAMQDAAFRYVNAREAHYQNRRAVVDVLMQIAPSINGSNKQAGDTERAVIAALRAAGHDLTGLETALFASVVGDSSFHPFLDKSVVKLPSPEGWEMSFARMLEESQRIVRYAQDQQKERESEDPEIRNLRLHFEKKKAA